MTAIQHNLWSGFHKKAIKERTELIRLAYPSCVLPLKDDGCIDLDLPLTKADNMVENCIGVLGVPVGLATNFVINGSSVLIPMAIEEPSVIAATNGAAKTLGRFEAKHELRNQIVGQMLLSNVEDVQGAIEMVIMSSAQHSTKSAKLKINRTSLMNRANSFCSSMRARGGGVQDIYSRIVPICDEASSWLVLHVVVDVCDAMGANCVNTVLEGIAPFIESILNSKVDIKICSNLNTSRIVESEFCISIDKMSYKGFSGENVVKGIIKAQKWAMNDSYRAATHNKGIMNGIDAVALATGQDWRAIESGAHAFSSCTETGTYQPLTSYWTDGNEFHGRLRMPISVGTKGGVLTSNNSYQNMLSLMGNPSSSTLAMIMVSVGLAQNFGALRALVTEGIQRGHMSLHAHNIALSVGCPDHIIPEVTSYMIHTNRINATAVKEYLSAHELHSAIRVQNAEDLKQQNPLSTFYFEEANATSENSVSLNIAFQPLNMCTPVHLGLTPETPVPLTNWQQKLLGNKGHQWLSDSFDILDKIKLNSVTPPRANQLLSKKLKLLSILTNIIGRRLSVSCPEEYVSCALELTSLVKSSTDIGTIKDMDDADATKIRDVGIPLFLAIHSVFKARVQQWIQVDNQLLADAILNEQRSIIKALAQDESETEFSKFMRRHVKRFQATMFLLCDLIYIDNRHITESRVNYIKSLGTFFEWHGTICHDVSKVFRALKEARFAELDTLLPNCFLKWMIARKDTAVNFDMTGLESLKEEFTQQMKSLGEQEGILPVQCEDSVIFDEDKFKEAVVLIESYFQQSQNRVDLLCNF